MESINIKTDIIHIKTINNYVIIIVTFRLINAIIILFKKLILQISNIFSGIEIHFLKFYVLTLLLRLFRNQLFLRHKQYILSVDLFTFTKSIDIKSWLKMNYRSKLEISNKEFILGFNKILENTCRTSLKSFIRSFE